MAFYTMGHILNFVYIRMGHSFLHMYITIGTEFQRMLYIFVDKNCTPYQNIEVTPPPYFSISDVPIT